MTMLPTGRAAAKNSRRLDLIGQGRRSGFTLIELVFVIFLLALFVGFAVPKFNAVTTINLRSAARELSALIKFTYNRAVMSKQEYRLVLNMADGSYWVEVLVLPAPKSEEELEKEANNLTFDREDEENKRRPMYEKTGGYLMKPGRLPDGVTIARFYDLRGHKEYREGYVYLQFFPEGETTGGYLYLATKDEIRVTLEVNPITGKVINHKGMVDVAG